MARSSTASTALLLGTLLIFAGPAAAQTTEHPFIEPNDIKSETCLTCHPDKREGRFVHTAVGMGCEKCHQATSDKGKQRTTITLVATGGELCSRCHEPNKDPVQHGPYKNGHCLTCHNPHASNFPRQARAETNTLCLSCHGENQPDVRIDREAQTVSLLDGRSLSLADYQQSPKISLDPSGAKGHPIAGHPITGKDPRRKGATLTCLSCHVPHSSKLPMLIPPEIKSAVGLCVQCHQ